MAAFIILCVLLSSQPPIAEAEESAICIDADFDDWNEIPAAVVDPADATESPVDFGEVRIASTAHSISLLIDFGRTVNAQGLDAHAMILLDADGNRTTGTTEFAMLGVDVIVDLSPASVRSFGRTQHNMGMGLRSTTYSADPNDANAKHLSVYDIGLLFAPTYAARRMEFTLNRGAHLPQTPPFLTGEQAAAKLVCVDRSGKMTDETAIIDFSLPPFDPAGPIITQPDDPFARKDDALRVVSWNVERGAMFNNPQPFIRTIQALKPDVILFQELTDRNTAAQLKTFLARTNASPEQRSWNVVFGEGGGDLRCAIASPLPLEDVASLKRVQLGNNPDRTLRVAGAMLQDRDHSILLVSLHLRCCGRAGGPEDLARLEEVETLRQVVQGLGAEMNYAGIVIGGDFNLVGSRDPLETIAASVDRDHSSLAIAPALQFHRRSNATWSDSKQPFAPGRLDYMLYSDSTLSLQRSFVYDSRQLSESWLKIHNVQPDDTAMASDHLPIVIDLNWVESATSENAQP